MDSVNDEEYFKKKEEKMRNDTMQYELEKSLAQKNISMADISADMANSIITHPLLVNLPEEDGNIAPMPNQGFI